MADILRRAGGGPEKFYCYSSAWEKKRFDETGVLHRVDESNCNLDLDSVKWTVYPDVVNGQFRCEEGGVVAEYSIQAFRKSDSAYKGGGFCTTGQYPADEFFEFGSVTDLMETPY